MANLIKNSIITPDGNELISSSVHDFKLYKDKITEKEYGIDGGLEYIRLIGDITDCKVVTIYDTDDIEIVREEFKWGTFGKEGDKFTKKKLKDLSNEHINNIIKTQHQLSKDRIEMFKKELKYRKIHNIIIND